MYTCSQNFRPCSNRIRGCLHSVRRETGDGRSRRRLTGAREAISTAYVGPEPMGAPATTATAERTNARSFMGSRFQAGLLLKLPGFYMRILLKKRSLALCEITVQAFRQDIFSTDGLNSSICRNSGEQKKIVSS